MKYVVSNPNGIAQGEPLLSILDAVERADDGDIISFNVPENEIHFPAKDTLSSAILPIRKTVKIEGNHCKFIGNGTGVGLIVESSSEIQDLCFINFSIGLWIREADGQVIENMLVDGCSFSGFTHAGLMTGNHVCNAGFKNLEIKNCSFVWSEETIHEEASACPFAAIISPTIGLGKGTPIQDCFMDTVTIVGNKVDGGTNKNIFEGIFVYDTYDLSYAALLPDFQKIASAKKHSVQNVTVKNISVSDNTFLHVGDGELAIMCSTIGPNVENCIVQDVLVKDNKFQHSLCGLSVCTSDIYSFGEEIVEQKCNKIFKRGNSEQFL